MIKIKEIEIPLPKWWQVGLIIIAVVIVIIVLKENPEKALNVMEETLLKVR
jgi:hypothetical protein